MSKVYSYAIDPVVYGKHLRQQLCLMKEKEQFADVEIVCGKFTFTAHRFMLSLGSSYFAEQLRKHKGTKRIIIKEMDSTVLRSILELIYCGETSIKFKDADQTFRAATSFQLPQLGSLVANPSLPAITDGISIPSLVFVESKTNDQIVQSDHALITDKNEDLHKLDQEDSSAVKKDKKLNRSRKGRRKHKKR